MARRSRPPRVIVSLPAMDLYPAGHPADLRLVVTMLYVGIHAPNVAVIQWFWVVGHLCAQSECLS